MFFFFFLVCPCLERVRQMGLPSGVREGGGACRVGSPKNRAKMTPEKPKRAFWVGHGLEPRPQFHEKTQRQREERSKAREETTPTHRT